MSKSSFFCVFYKKFYKHAWWIALLLLALVLVAGKTINGAKRWIYLTESLSFQPSEFVKLLMIIFYAGILVKNRDELSKYGKNVVLIYGNGSIKRNGIYDSVISILKKQGKDRARICRRVYYAKIHAYLAI